MKDEKKKSQLDADILQSMADIQEALRAAGKPVLSKSPSGDIQIPPFMPQDTDLEMDMSVLENVSPPHLTPPETISEVSAPAPTDELILPSDDRQTLHETAAENARLQQELRKINDYLTKLLNENRQLKLEMEEFRKTGLQSQRQREELSKTEITLSQERSKIRALEAKLGDMENQQRSFDQERQTFINEIEQSRQEIQNLTEGIERLRAESILYKDRTGREMADLNQQVEHLTSNRLGLQKDYDQLRHEYEAYQTQADGETAHLTEELEELRKAEDQQRQTIHHLNEEIRAETLKANLFSETTQKLETLQAELAETRDLLLQERQSGLILKQEAERLESLLEEQKGQKELLQSQIQQQQSREQTLLADSALLQEQFGRQRQELTEQIEHILLEKQRIQNGFEKICAEYSNYRNQVRLETADRENQIKQLMEEYQTLKNTHEQLLPVVCERDDLKKRIKDYLIYRDELTAQLATLQNKYDSEQASQKNKTDALYIQYQAVLEENERLKNQISDLKTYLEEVTQAAHTGHDEGERFGAAEVFLQKEPEFAEPLQGETTIFQEGPISAETSPKAEWASPADETTACEKSDSASQIPVFNLAEQILAEHRRVVSSRRQRIEPTEATLKHESIRQVVQHYVGSISRSPEIPKHAEFSVDFVNNDSLSPFQRELLEEIIRKEIEQLSEKANRRKILLMTS